MRNRIFSFLFSFAVLFAFVSSMNVFAQNRMVKGVVIDDTDMGVIGAAVMIKGTQTGVATDVDGNFEISVANGDVLVISSVGYDEVEVTVTPQTKDLKIQLTTSSEFLDDVVVIGYGTTRAKNFTGSVDVMKMEDSPVANLGLNSASDMLRGRMSGVVMGAESNRVGQNSSMLVRGRKSINSTSSAPLLVVNGVIFTGTIEDIDANSIESISVLKDATSLAAYGSKAANGVIMVTLKKGKEGKPMINFSTSQQVQGRSYDQKVLSPEGYIKYMNARKGLSDLTDTSWMSFLEKENYAKGETTDWRDFTTQTGYTANYNLNISGRTTNSNYYVAFGHQSQKGIIIGDEFRRNNMSMNLSTNITKNIEVGANVAFTNQVNDSNSAGTDVFHSPYAEPYLPDGKTLRYYIEGVNSATYNPLWSAYHGDKDNRRKNLNIGGYINVKIPWVEGLSYKMTLSYTEVTSKNYSFTYEDSAPKLLSNDLEGIGQSAAYLDLANAQGSVSNSLSKNWVIDNILSYAKQFGQHYVSASLVYTRDSAESTSESMTGKGFTSAGNTLKGWYGLEDADVKTISSPSYSLHTDVGYLARVMYSYKDKYHFNASLRRDGSSVFGEDNKWGNFPAVGAAWTVTKEDFMKGITWLDMLKLKASWGKNGAQTLSPYGTLTTVALAKAGGIANYYGGTIHWGQKLSTLGNPTLGWQTTTSWNGGFEADFLKGNIHVDVNAYTSKTTDQIFNRNIPVMTAGITTQKATMGQVNNHGLEINLSTVNLKRGDFTWTSDVVFTLNRNKIAELYGDGQDDIANNLFIGQPINVVYAYVTDGIFQKDDAEFGQYAGQPIFYTKDGQRTVNPSADDREILGYTDENFRMSLANTLRYKNWQLYIMFNGIFGGNGYGIGNNTFAYSTYSTQMSTTALNIPFYTDAEPSTVYPKSNYSDSKYQVYNSYGHVRLQDLSLSYNFSKFAKKIGVNSARLTLAGRNLFFIAPHWKMSDPQARSRQAGYLPRTLNLGLNVSF